MGNGRDVSEQEIVNFLDLFNGDREQAIKGINDLYFEKLHYEKRSTIVSSGPVIININSVKKTYKIGRQQVHALNGVSLQIRQGEFIALTGPSGSGKSTLLQLIGGLDKVTEGTVEVVGVKLANLSDSKLSQFRNKTIGFIFQFFYLQPFLKVGVNLELPGMFARTNRKKRKIDALELAKSVGIDDRINHLPKELSGGQMQRAAIARALLNKPKILLADEPTGNLDSVNGASIIELFENIRKEFGTTIIIVTHDQKIAERADREIKLVDGVVV